MIEARTHSTPVGPRTPSITGRASDYIGLHGPGGEPKPVRGKRTCIRCGDPISAYNPGLTCFRHEFEGAAR